MFMKARYILLLSLATIQITTPLQATLEINPYANQARSWVKSHIGSMEKGILIEQHDLHFIANLVYFSYYRSKITLDAQECTLDALNSIWQSFENITHTRLNPSHGIPHAIFPHQQEALLEKFLRIAPKHRTVGTTYSHAIELIVDGNILQSAHALKGMLAVRSEARAVVAQALCDVKQILGTLYGDARTKACDVVQHMATQEQSSRGFPFLDYLWTYIPQLAMQSFIEADNLNNILSQEAWDALQKGISVATQTWQTVETARASYYLAHYKALYDILQTVDCEFRTIMFNENGLIPLEHRTELLPAPENLP